MAFFFGILFWYVSVYSSSVWEIGPIEWSILVAPAEQPGSLLYVETNILNALAGDLAVKWKLRAAHSSLMWRKMSCRLEDSRLTGQKDFIQFRRLMIKVIKRKRQGCKLDGWAVWALDGAWWDEQEMMRKGEVYDRHYYRTLLFTVRSKRGSVPLPSWCASGFLWLASLQGDPV